MRVAKSKRPTIRPALTVAQFLWPYFWSIHDCVFVSFSNDCPKFNPPSGITATDWEAFVNHTHIFDEFRNQATTQIVLSSQVLENGDTFSEIEETYNEVHPDFIAACELGKTAVRTWSLKLKLDFPDDRFRVYYTEYDNPIIRFHKVRSGDGVWLSDEALRNNQHPDFRNALIYDTDDLANPVFAAKVTLN